MRFGGRRAPGYGVIVGWPEDPDILLTGPRGRRLCWELVAEMARPAQARVGPAWGQAEVDSLDVGPAELAGELVAAAGQTACCQRPPSPRACECVKTGSSVSRSSAG
jgi:hypothetical protein